MEKKTISAQPLGRPQASPQDVPSQGQSPLSIHRAFVVQFRAETDVEKQRFVGRVEHVASGQVAYFDSLEGLLAFIRQILIQLKEEKHTEGKG